MKLGADPTRALVVEDDRSVSEMGAILLEQFDLIVTQVRTAEAALEHLQAVSGEVAVLLADIRLPGPMNGIGLVRRVAVLWPSVSLIVTSGGREEDVQGLPERAVYVPKPWRPLDLVAAAERAARADHSVKSLAL